MRAGKMSQGGKYDFIVDVEVKRLSDAAGRSGSASSYAELANSYNVRGMFPQALEAADRATALDEEHFTGWFEYAIAASAVGGEHLTRILERTRDLLRRGVGNEGEIKTALALTNYYLAQEALAQSEEALYELRIRKDSVTAKVERWQESFDRELLLATDDLHAIEDALLREADAEYLAYLHARLRSFAGGGSQ